MKLINPLDMHLRLRDTSMLECVTPYSARDLRAAVIMPNLIPPLCSLNALKAYKSHIIKASEDELFTSLITPFFQHCSERFLEETRSGIFGVRPYPAGITTNSSGGVSNFGLEALEPTLSTVNALEIPLLTHGETNDFVMDREADFARIYEKLVLNSPKLKIVMECITARALCKLLKDYENLYATITLHHLTLSPDDVIGGKIQPHLFCKPITKAYKGREALCKLAFSRYERAIFGNDSAPHPQNGKECCGCTAGVFSSPVTLSVLAGLFERNSNESSLQRFLSNNACEIHKLSFQKNKIVELKKEKWQIKENRHKIMPFMTERCLEFRLFTLE